jgi:hypothetical protein
MTYPVSITVKLSPDHRAVFPFRVRGIWVDDHIEHVSVLHGDESLKPGKHDALILAAKEQAEREYRGYLIDQLETRDDIVKRLCGTR